MLPLSLPVSTLARPHRLVTLACALIFTAPITAPFAQAQAVVLPASEQQAPVSTGTAAPPIGTVVVRPPSGLQLPALGDSASDDLSLGNERKLGVQVMREIRVDPDYLDDPVLLEYLQSVWRPLVAAARQRGEITADIDTRFAWEPFLVRDPEVNAFALPGGYVGVNLGLIAMTTTSDELASVLAHEMSHVTQRHIARKFANSRTQGLIGTAAMILGVLAASRSVSRNGDAANAVITGGQAAAIQGQLNFSREMEREADRVGFGVMTTAGYAPGGMTAMFEKLDHASRLNDFGGFPYLRTHPMTTERIGEARARMGTAPVRETGPIGVLEHATAQARARVLMDTRVDALRRWQALDAPPPDASAPPSVRAESLSNAYASALASTLLRDWSRADVALQHALDACRGGPRTDDAHAERAVRLLQAESSIARGDLRTAAATLKPYEADGSRPVLLYSAQAALKSQNDLAAIARSADALQTWVAVHKEDADAWNELGALWARLGQNLRSVRAEAESRIALGDLNGAVDRLRAGQRMAQSAQGSDFIEASVIDSRLREVEGERKRLAVENKQPG